MRRAGDIYPLSVGIDLKFKEATTCVYELRHVESVDNLVVNVLTDFLKMKENKLRATYLKRMHQL